MWFSETCVATNIYRPFQMFLSGYRNSYFRFCKPWLAGSIPAAGSTFKWVEVRGFLDQNPGVPMRMPVIRVQTQ